jgi:hypothetical protein
MSRDRGGNGIQEVAGSIPVGSTKSFKWIREVTTRREKSENPNV